MYTGHQDCYNVLGKAHPSFCKRTDVGICFAATKGYLVRHDDPEATEKVRLVDVDHAQNYLRTGLLYNLARPLLLNSRAVGKNNW